MKTKIFLLAALMVASFISCNPDVQLGSDENIPKVAEHILGLPTQQAIDYLASEGYVFGYKNDFANEYVFSRDPNISGFSYEASTMLGFGTFTGDTVQYASGLQRMNTEKSACDLYLKWSYYSAKFTMPRGTAWSGNITLKQHADDRYTTYSDGDGRQQALAQLEEDYKNGKITKEQYDMWMEVYRHNKDMFWADYKQENATDNIYSAYEQYVIPESTGHPKELELVVYTNNGGNIELMYNISNFVKRLENKMEDPFSTH